MLRCRWMALAGLWLFCSLSSRALGQTLSLLDESGAPTSVYVEKTRVYVQVTDPVANVSPDRDTIEARLSTAIGGDVELVTLTETGASTGVFRGDIALGRRGSVSQQGVLETDVLHDPPYGRDTISADYGNGLATATASLVGSATRLLDGYGRPATSFALGETIFIRVVAPLRNDPNYIEDLYIQVEAGSDQLSVDLRETGVDTGVFEGSVATSGGSPVLGNNVLEAAPGQTVQATFADLDNPTSSQASATLAASGVELIDARGNPATFYLESSRAYVRVRDFAANLNPSTRDTSTVQMTADLSGDQETVMLQETGESTGVFEGSVPLRRGPGAPGNGTLETTASSGAPYRFDTVHATHADGAGNSTDTVDTIGSLTFFLDGYGSEVTSYPEGARVYLRVEDHNFNDPSRLDTVTATVQASPSGDADTVTLVETGRDTGIFEGSIPTRTSSSGSGDGILTVQAGQTILAQHVDANNVLASGAQASVQSFDIHFIAATGEPTVELVEGGTARVRVACWVANANPSLAETVIVLLQTLYSQDQEELTLTETGPDTGVFEGSIRLNHATTGTQSNGVLETGSNNQPPFQPDEVTAIFPNVSATARMVGSRVWFIDDYGRTTTSFPVGGNVGVRVEKPAANNPAYWDQIYNFEIDVRDGNLTNSYYLSLNETGVDTGIFEGYIPSATVSNSLSVIRAAPGLPLQAISWGPFSSTVATANAVFTGGQVLFVDAQGQPASVYLEGTRAYARVIDHQRSGSVAVTVTSEVTGDQETLTLTETSGGSGVFEGSIELRSGYGYPGNGILETGVDNGPPVHYDTLTASYTDSGGLPETATASTLGYRVWFLDAAGNVVASYVPGARAYVRLEDHNFNNLTRNDILYVELYSSNGDHEFLEVDETGSSTGIYEGSLPLEFAAATPGDGRLQAAGGGQISADRQGPWFPAPVYARIESSSIEIVDAAGRPVSEVLENGTVHVRVNHPEANTNPGAVETVTAQLQSVRAGDQETVTLTETGPDTGLFEGSIQLRYGYSASFGDGFLETAHSQTLETEEITASYGAHSVTVPTVLARMTFVGLRDQPVASYGLRSLVRIKVEDLIDNDPGQIDSLNVTVSSPETNDLEPVTLTETGANTGVFYGSIPSLETSGSSFDGVLWVGAGQTATARLNGFAGQLEAQIPFNSNYVPVAQDDFGQTGQSVPLSLSVLSNDYDPEGTLISLTAVSQGALGTVTSETYGYITYTPNPGASGTDTFTYVVADEQGGEAIGRVTITITGLPIANDDTASLDEDGTVEIPVLANDSDPVGLGLQVVIASAPAHGTVFVTSDQTVVYTPAPANYNGSDSFTYSVSDGNNGTATATVTITVTPVNDPPVAYADSATVAEDGTVDIAVLANDTDVENDVLTVTSVTQGAHGAVVINPDNTVKYTPAANYNGSDAFLYTVSDGNGGTATGTVTITVTSVNDAPVANADSATVAEDGTVNVAVLGNDTDVDGDTLSVSSVTQGAHGAVVINPDKTVKYTPAANYNGSDSFTYTVSDGNGGTATGTVTVTVTSVNDAPVANDDSATVAEDGMVNMAVLTNDTDPEGDTLTVTSVTQGAHGAVAINPDKTVKYTPAANYNGSDSFTYTVSDGNGGTATGTVTITVTSVNDAPVANADSATVAEDGTVNVAVLGNDTDADGDTLSVTAVTQGAHGAVAINPDKTVKYTPAANYNGSDSFTYTVSDGNGGSATATVTITVTSVNDAPVANADSATVAEDGTVNVAVLGNDTDADGDTLSVTAATQGAHGAVAINPDKTVKYTPAANYNGSDSFTYTVSDGNGGSATGTVTITVTSVNDAPVANADSATVAEDGTVNVAVLGSDTDPEGDTLTVSSVTQGAHGAVVINPDKTVKYTPSANYNGSDSFTYTVSDGNGGTATGTVTITVTSVNDAPVANADAATVAEDGTVNVAVLGNDTDVDGDTLSVSAVTQGAHGTVAINPDKTVKYTPAANYNGPDSFTYTVSDGNGGLATGTVTITVTSVNDLPVANADTAAVVEDGTVNIAVLGNDTDPEGDTLTVSSVTQGAHGAVVINPDKTVKYTPAANYNGPDSFTYTVSDGNGGTASATVVVNVTAVNDAPVAVNDSASVVTGQAVTVSVLANDADIDGPGLTVTSVTQGAHGTVAINPDQTVTYTAALYVGTDSFTYTVSDGAGGTATATVNVTVTAPPRITTGIQARYDFNEGSGSTVNDTSGVGTPLNLTIASPSSVTWISGGLRVNTATAISTSGVASKIISAAQAGNGITVEAWVSPSSLTLTGPAHIAMLMKNATQRNLIFGQSGSRYETQLKTSTGTASLQSPASSLTQSLTHVVYTRSSSGAAIWYVNGVQVSTQTTTGNLSTWGTDQKLTLADNWQGSYFLLAVYGRALTSAEVRQNYLAGVN